MPKPTAESSDRVRLTYDPLDNLRTASLGIATNTYNYDASNKLVSLARSSGGTATYVTDAQGNIRDDGRLAYNFDVAHRLMESDVTASTTLKEKYRYDGLGRRVYQERPGGAQTLSIYSQAGQMLFRFDNLPTQRTREHVYLAGSLVASIDHDWPSNTVTATNYQHTDALGSPVAVTAPDRHIVERTYYTPYGLPINHAVEGVGYTGHVMDSATGLTYMQQRYYDPTIGRFVSNDPVATNAGNGSNFNRYWYASNNPFGFTDPDGRKEKPFDPNVDAPRNTHEGTGSPLEVPQPTGGDSVNPDAYNCTSDAWHQGNGDAGDPESVYPGAPNWDNSVVNDVTNARTVGGQLDPSAPNRPGDVVVYGTDVNRNGRLDPSELRRGDAHSASVTEVDAEGNTTRVRSKEGDRDVVDHHPSDQNKEYGTFKEWYRPVD